MSAFLWPKTGNPLSPTFEFDVQDGENRRDPYQWTPHAIEDGGNMADYGDPDPKQFSLSGMITATPWDQPYSLARVTNAYEELAKEADKCDEFHFVGLFFTGTAVIKSINGSHKAAGGDKLDVTIELETIAHPTSSTVDVPPARMKPKVKKRAPAGKKGGASSGTAPGSGSTQKRTSLLKKGTRKAGWFK